MLFTDNTGYPIRRTGEVFDAYTRAWLDSLIRVADPSEGMVFPLISPAGQNPWPRVTNVHTTSYGVGPLGRLYPEYNELGMSWMGAVGEIKIDAAAITDGHDSTWNLRGLEGGKVTLLNFLLDEEPRRY